jgi:hypothetical protein
VVFKDHSILIARPFQITPYCQEAIRQYSSYIRESIVEYTTVSIIATIKCILENNKYDKKLSTKQQKIISSIVKTKIIGYFRYVDDILMIYNETKTNIDETIVEFNEKDTTIRFSMEKEQHNSINFLDLTIHRKNTEYEFEIYRKPTQKYIIMPNDSCHPHEHKISAINYLINRVNTYPINKRSKQERNSHN